MVFGFIYGGVWGFGCRGLGLGLGSWALGFWFSGLGLVVRGLGLRGLRFLNVRVTCEGLLAHLSVDM